MRAVSRRSEIVARATEIFEAKGVARTTFEDVARELGLTREAIYYYFRNREELLVEVILPQSREMLANLQAILESDRSHKDKLRAAVENQLARYYPSYLDMSVALRESGRVRTSRKLEALRRNWQDYDRAWTELISAGQRDGAFKPDLEPKMAAYGIIGMCNWVTRWYDPAKSYTIREIIDCYASIAVDGVCVGG